MPKEKQQSLSDKEKKKLLDILESSGRGLHPEIDKNRRKPVFLSRWDALRKG